MYVIAKKRGDEFSFLSEVFFGSDLTKKFPQVMVRTQFTFSDLPELDYPYNSDLMYFENKADAYALLVAMDLLGAETCDLRVMDVEVPGNE